MHTGNSPISTRETRSAKPALAIASTTLPLRCERPAAKSSRDADRNTPSSHRKNPFDPLPAAPSSAPAVVLKLEEQPDVGILSRDFETAPVRPAAVSKVPPQPLAIAQKKPPAAKITVLLAEDHAIVRQGLSALLKMEPDFQIVGEAQTGREAVTMAARLQPDVILMDIAMPTLNGIVATRQIVAANPSARVLILSAHFDDEYVERTSAAGACGFIEKQMTGEILAKAIRAVAAGDAFFSPTIAESIRRGIGKLHNRRNVGKATGSTLTTRELEILQLVAEGRANKQVSAELGISIKTVEKHRQHLMDKLNIHETAGLTRYAITMGIIENRIQPTIRH
ncbi:MAG: response regulator transcription factor [Undibacterium sp.]|nr:response regulator transcription factor [Opitutaceae bacterium]